MFRIQSIHFHGDHETMYVFTRSGDLVNQTVALSIIHGGGKIRAKIVFPETWYYDYNINLKKIEDDIDNGELLYSEIQHVFNDYILKNKES